MKGFPFRDPGNFSLGRREMLSTPSVLIVCSDTVQRDEATEILRRIGLPSVHCSSLTDARALIERQTFQFVLCNDDLPDCNLRTAVRVLSSFTGGIPVIVLSHLADWGAYIRALNAGAFDYIACPPEPIETERILRLALDQNPSPHRASQTAA
jgi:DNA-binding NtrC family response regulator